MAYPWNYPLELMREGWNCRKTRYFQGFVHKGAVFHRPLVR